MLVPLARFGCAQDHHRHRDTMVFQGDVFPSTHRIHSEEIDYLKRD